MLVRALGMNSNETAQRETWPMVENNRVPELRSKGFMASVLPYLMMKHLQRVLSSLAGYYSSENRRCTCLDHSLNLWRNTIQKEKENFEKCSLFKRRVKISTDSGCAMRLANRSFIIDLCVCVGAAV